MPAVKAPPGHSESPEAAEYASNIEANTGELTQSDYSTWIGNTLVLISIGTLALLVPASTNVNPKTLKSISDAFLILALTVLSWATYKFFFINTKKVHKSDWVLFVLVLFLIGFIIWLAIIV